MISMPQVFAIDPTSPLLSAVKQLGRKHSGTLGFFPMVRLRIMRAWTFASGIGERI